MTNLSVPSVIFADDEGGATWYGSLRAGVEFGGGQDARLKSSGSRWGVKGSGEVSEGLSAVYQFESRVDTTNGTQTHGGKADHAAASAAAGRLSYVGLSGGFGTVTMGRVWSASFNHVGAITDGSWFYGNSHTSYHVNNALSYAASVGPVSMQIDALMDRNQDTDSAVDSVEFGLSVDLGDIGKVGLAHVNQKDKMSSMMVDVRDSTYAITMPPGKDDVITLALKDGMIEKTSKVEWRDKKTGEIVPSAYVSKVMHTTGTGATALPVMAMIVYDDGASTAAPTMGSVTKDDDGNLRTASCPKTTALKDCKAYAVWVSTDKGTVEAAAANTSDGLLQDAEGKTTDLSSEDMFAVVADAMVNHTGTASVPTTTPGSKSNHIAVQLALGPVTGYLGHSTTKMNGSGDKDKVTHYGLSGGLGDSGFSFHAMGRKVEPAAGMESSPWLIGVTKGLGGGASAMIEHGNSDDGNSGTTRVGLKVDF